MIPAREAWERARRGEIVVVDLRPPPDFCRGHPTGAISVVSSERGLAERIAIAVPGTLPVVLVVSDPAQATAATGQLAAAGRACLGALPDDPVTWQGVPWEALPELPLTALDGRRIVVDVREPLEWETGYVPGATLIPLGCLHDALDRLPRDREIAVICEAGIRSATAASILQAAGFSSVAHVPAGTAGYRAAGLPLAYPDEEVD